MFDLNELWVNPNSGDAPKDIMEHDTYVEHLVNVTAYEPSAILVSQEQAWRHTMTVE